VSRRRTNRTTSPPKRQRRKTPLAAGTSAKFSKVSVTAVVLLVIISNVLFLRTSDYGLMGWDSYPIIISSRVQSFGDFLGNFGEKLMDGRYESDFYRPLVNMSFAVDYALWGLRPFGYQLTNVLLFAGCAASLFFFVRRAAGPGCTVAALATLVVFLLHPTHYEVLPVPSRRPEMLCCMFMTLSLATQLSPRSLGLRRPPIIPAVLALLAIAAKETAFILPILSFVAVVLYSPRPTWGRRMLHAAVAVIPHGIAAVAMLATRIAILGGLGGHESTRLSEAFYRFPAYVLHMLGLLLFPQSVMLRTGAGKWMLIGLGVGLVLTGVLMLWSNRQKLAERAADRRLLRTSVIAVVWLLLLGLTYAVTGKVRPWYLLLPVAGFAVLVGVLIDALLAVVLRRRLRVRLAAAPTLLLLLALVVWQGRYSPLACEYDDWDRATAASRSFLDQLGARIARTEDGAIVEAPPIPTWAKPRDDRPHIQGAAILAEYSVQAWAELTFPQRRIRVRLGQDARDELPAADEVVVSLTNRLEGF
jgi:hypothetical protein